MYRLGDVRRGDRVDVNFDSAKGRITCTAVSILRRPGGRVPPAHCPPRICEHHVYMNACQDAEAAGLPWPSASDIVAGLPPVAPPAP